MPSDFLSYVAPINVTSVTASCGVVPATAPFNVASITASFDAAPATAPTTTLSVLSSPVPVLLTFPSSPLALFASALWFLNTSTFAVIPRVTLSHLRNMLAGRNVEYRNREDLFVTREVGAKRLMAEVQYLTELLSVLQDQDAQRLKLLDSRGNQIGSLQRELAEVCACLLVSANVLATKTHVRPLAVVWGVRLLHSSPVSLPFVVGSQHSEKIIDVPVLQSPKVHNRSIVNASAILA